MLQSVSNWWEAVPLEGCASKTTATGGALIMGGKRLLSLGNEELLFSALIAGSSSAPPEKGSEHLSLKPKLQLSLTLLLPCGAWNVCWLRGCMKTDVSKRAHLFQMFRNTGFGISGIFYVWVLLTNQYLKQKFTDLRKTLSSGGWSHSHWFE